MSSEIVVAASSLEAALTDAIAELVDCPADDVDLQLSAPGLSKVSGPVRFRLEISDQRDDDREPPTSAQEEVAPDQEGVDPADLDEEADAAADFLEGLLDALDLPGDLRIRVKDDHAEVELIDVGSGALIGRRGQTLEAIQELVRSALQRRFERRARVLVDVEGYRARRLEKLLEKAEEEIDAVLDSGRAARLEPMDVFERKAIHQLVAEVDGLTSRSQGREPGRRVVIEPA